MLSKYFSKLYHPKKNVSSDSATRNTVGPVDNEGTRSANCSVAIPCPDSGKSQQQTHIDIPKHGRCVPELPALSEEQLSSPSVPVAISSNREAMPRMKSVEVSAAIVESVCDGKLLETSSIGLSVSGIVLNNNVDDHVIFEGEDNDEDNDDDDIVLEEEQKIQQSQRACPSSQPVFIFNSNTTSPAAALDAFSHPTTGDSSNGSASMAPFYESKKFFNATPVSSVGKNIDVSKGYGAEDRMAPPRFPQTPSSYAHPQDHMHQSQQCVTDTVECSLQQRPYISFSPSSEDQRKIPCVLHAVPFTRRLGHSETSLINSAHQSAWGGVSVGEGDDVNESETDDDYIELTGGTLDEPMTPHSYSSMRNLSQTRRRAARSLPTLIPRAPCSKGVCSSASCYSPPRYSSLNTSSSLFPQQGSECPASPHTVDGGRQTRLDDASAQLTPLSRPMLWQPPNLPSEPSSLESLNVGGLCVQPFKDSVLECNRAEIRVIGSNQKLLNEKYVIYLNWNLGAGSHSKVLLCYGLESKVYYAMKILDRGRLQRRGIGVGCAVHQIKREIAILKKLRHPSIVALVEVIDDPHCRKIYLVLELAEYGGIMSMDNDGTVLPVHGKSILPEREVARVMRSVLSALGYAHQLGIAHRDIKPPNIILTAQGEVKLSDFGVSLIVDESAERVRREGSVAFLPPEILVSPEVTVTPRGRVSCHGTLRTTQPLLTTAGAGSHGTHTVRTVGTPLSSTSAVPVEPPEATTHACSSETVGRMESAAVPMSTTFNSLPIFPYYNRLSNSTTELTGGSLTASQSGPTSSLPINAMGGGSFTAPVDLFRADVFSVGITAFVLLMGRLPWRANDALSQLRAILSNPDPFAIKLCREDAQQSEMPPPHLESPCPVPDFTAKATRLCMASSTNVNTNLPQISPSTCGDGSSQKIPVSSFSSPYESHGCAEPSSLREDQGDLSQLPETHCNDVSSMAMDFIRRCTCIEPSKRATIAELCAHSWIQQLEQSEGVAAEEVTGTSLHDSCGDTTTAPPVTASQLDGGVCQE